MKPNVREMDVLTLQEFEAWNHGNRLVDESGMPKVWYHGTDADADFNVFTQWGEGSIGFHAGPLEAAETRIAQMTEGFEDEQGNGTVIPMYIRALNPLVMDDLYTWSTQAIVSELLRLEVIDESGAEFLDENFDCSYIYAVLERAGCDCVLYENKTEGAGQSIFFWHAQQAKSVFATSYGIADPRLNPAAEARKDDLSAWIGNERDIAEAKKEYDAFLEAGAGKRFSI